MLLYMQKLQGDLGRRVVNRLDKDSASTSSTPSQLLSAGWMPKVLSSLSLTILFANTSNPTFTPPGPQKHRKQPPHLTIVVHPRRNSKWRGGVELRARGTKHSSGGAFFLFWPEDLRP